MANIWHNAYNRNDVSYSTTTFCALQPAGVITEIKYTPGSESSATLIGLFDVEYNSLTR